MSCRYQKFGGHTLVHLGTAVIIPPYEVLEGYIGYCVCFFCSVKLFSAVAGLIGAKFSKRHEPDASQVLRDFWGAT